MPIASNALPLVQIDADLCTDVIAFAPWDEGDPVSVLACGTYELEKDGTRHGGTYRFAFHTSSEDDDAGPVELSRVWRASSSAVFDLAWSPDGQSIVEAATDGHVHVYSRNNATRRGSARICSDAMATSVDIRRDRLACASSSGCVSVLDWPTLAEQRQWRAHDLEAWTCAFDKHDECVVYSGADDCSLRSWDVRAPDCVLHCTGHTMGVTSLASHPCRPNVLASGSYDETVRLWDTRSMKGPMASYEAGGGVWCLKWHPSYDIDEFRDLLLCANMHNGFAVVSATGARIRPVASLRERDDSIAYGCDWCRDPTTPDLIASCSFYDKRIRLWRLTVDE
ncbi:methylated diphthine methylhydrolase [Plasmodiophora brassicae]